MGPAFSRRDRAAAIDEWTDTFMSRVAEIKAAQNCRM
jgi:hypothetical protein